jgi:hypothetical protein
VSLWEPLARLILDSCYESTLWAALQNSLETWAIAATAGNGKSSSEEENSKFVSSIFSVTKSETAAPATGSKSLGNEVKENKNKNTLFLTFIGGGVFGNKPEWIAGAIGRAMAEINYQCASRRVFPPNGPLKVKICHYRRVDDLMVKLVEESFLSHSEAMLTSGVLPQGQQAVDDYWKDRTSAR